MRSLKGMIVSISLLLASSGLGYEATVRSQAIMVRDARAALQSDRQLDSSGIQIAPKGSDTVILSGQVTSEQQRLMAVQALHQVPGIHKVIDRMHSGTGNAEEDLQLQSRITNRIINDPLMGADDEVEVDMKGAIADLGGIVDTWKLHREVTHDAFLGGAKEVLNHVRVREAPGASDKTFVYRKDPG